MKSYSQWNAYLVRKFFYESKDGDVITLRVSRAWFDRVAAMDGMGGYEDFLESMARPCDLIVCGDRTDVCANMLAMLARQRRCPGVEPWYVAYMVLLCLPWTLTEGWGNYYEYLPQPLRGMKINYTDRIRNRISQLVDREDANPRNDIFYCLKKWSDGRKNCEQNAVRGDFCYCSAHQNENLRVYYFLSQVFLSNDFAARLPTIFHYTPRNRYLDLEGIRQFCVNESNRFPISTQNIMNSVEHGANGGALRDELINVVYEYYRDWVDGGRRYTPQINSAAGGANYHSNNQLPPPDVRIAVVLTDDGFNKMVIVAKEDVGEGHLDLDHLMVGGMVAKGEWLPSGALKIVDGTGGCAAIWDRLANAGPADAEWNEDTFEFRRSKCFVLTQARPGSLLMVQQFAPPEELPCYLLYNTANSSNVGRWITQNRIVTTNLSVECNGWHLIGVAGITGEALAHLPDGVHGGDDNKDTCFAPSVRLVNGMRAERDGRYRTYFRDFLPDVEAYLPGDKSRYTISVNTLPATGDSVRVVEVGDDIGDDSETFVWRAFRIDLPEDCDIYQVNVDVTLDGRAFGQPHSFRLHERGNIGLSIANRTMDMYGEIAASNDYWPTLVGDEEGVVKNFPQEEECSCQLDAWQNYWAFIEDLSGRSTRGMAGSNFFALLGRYFTGELWRKRVLQLSYLCAVDIHTNKEGVWNKFYPIPEALAVLPGFANNGRVRAILIGSFGRQLVERMQSWCAQSTGMSICVYGQRVANNGSRTFSFMLPPRVVVEADAVERLTSLAGEVGIPVKMGLAAAFAERSASVEEWYNCINDPNCPGRRGGNPRNEEVGGWYDFLQYKMNMRDNGQLVNPLEQCPALFTSCMCAMPMPYSTRSYYDMVFRREGFTVSVKDRSWAKWNSYRLDPNFGVRFNLAYNEGRGIICLPEELKLPKILARAAVLCSGRIPVDVESPNPYDRMGQAETVYGLSIRPYQGRCQMFPGVPRVIAERIAAKLGANLKDF